MRWKRKQEQEHRNTKTYNSVNAVFNSRKPCGISVIWLLFKYLNKTQIEMKKRRETKKETQRLTI